MVELRDNFAKSGLVTITGLSIIRDCADLLIDLLRVSRQLSLLIQTKSVVCNGILTQKLGATIRDMDEFLKLLVRRMFDSCRIGCAFNVMSSHVNFMSPNLYYRSPAELLAWCMNEISARVILNSAYPLFEFTIYLSREDAGGLKYGDHRKVSVN